MWCAFCDYSSAVVHADNLREQYRDKLDLDVILGDMMIGDKMERECESFDYRRHIAFDITKMEIPIKCDICRKTLPTFVICMEEFTV